MDKLSNLKYVAGSRKNRKRVGRGEGSARGGTSTRGNNGQMSRSGAKRKVWFEGGQMPLQRRIPKFGFTNIFKVYYELVNVNTLQRLANEKKLPGEVLTAASLKNLGVISSDRKPVKVLGKGEIKVKVNLEVNAFSQKAKEKIEAAGGTIKKV